MTKDKHIWEQYTRGIEPTRRKKIPPPPRGEGRGGGIAARKSAEKIDISAAVLRNPLPNPPHKGEGTTLERKREKAMRQGDIDIDARIDLHGMTQVEAFAALAAFLRKKAAAGKRHLLIITGKGRGGAGILRGKLPDWLRQLPQAGQVLAVRPAAPCHGGDGAFYVVLKKKASEGG